MRRLIPFFVIYVLIQQDGQLTKAMWSDGQPVEGLLKEKCAGGKCTYQIVDQTTFEATKERDLAPAIDPAKEQALIDLNNKSKTAAERIDALIRYFDLGISSASTTTAAKTK